MRRFKERWNDMLPYEKVFNVISWVLLCGILITFILLFLDYEVFWIFLWLAVLNYICTTVMDWRDRRGFAYMDIALAVMFAIIAAQETFLTFH